MSPENTSFPLPADLPLEIGAQGEAYLLLNQELIIRGYNAPDIPATNEFTESTRQGLRYFREQRNQSDIPTLGADTLRSLTINECGQPVLTQWHVDNLKLKHHMVKGNPWKRNEITYYIAQPSKKLDPAIVEHAIAQAFQWWRTASDDLLSFEAVEDDSADIVISFFSAPDHGISNGFKDTVNFGKSFGKNPILAHAYYPLEKIEGSHKGDIHFNDDIAWKVGDGSDYDLITVAAHEIGHSLGLKHNTDTQSLMHPEYGGAYTSIPPVDQKELHRMYIALEKTFYTTISDQRGGGPRPVR